MASILHEYSVRLANSVPHSMMVVVTIIAAPVVMVKTDDAVSE